MPATQTEKSTVERHVARPRSLYGLGELPPLGVVPERMLAMTIRQDRYGKPADAFRLEEVPVPRIGPREVLVQVMAAGVNYNGVWAARGVPIDLIDMRNRRGEAEDFHIAGSDASGIVWKVGPDVRHVAVGDAVVVSTASFDPYARDILMGADKSTSDSLRAWGFETNYGSFAQYARVDEHQCYPKPARLSWAEASSYMLCAGTAYRQLMGWHPHVVQPGDPVLIWGGAGALGSMAIQIVRHAGGLPIAVVSDDERTEHCRRLGAHGVIDRREFTHWGPLPAFHDREALREWQAQAKAFGRRFWEALGERRNPRIVFEHTGAATLPTSVYLCDRAGMVVLCGGTTGYDASFDLRLLWMRQKRVQGSHGGEPRDYAAVNHLVDRGVLDPCLSRVVPLPEVHELHQLMFENRHPPGNMATLIGALGEGEKGV